MITAPCILITDYVHGLLIRGLRDAGFHVVYAPEMELALVRDLLPDFNGLIVNTRTPVDALMMQSSKRLQFIGRLGIGLDIFDVDEADRLGISIMNTPGANANAVGEHCFGLLLALMRKIPSANAQVKNGRWPRERNRGREIGGMTVGIIGFGNTGRAFASKFAGWQTRILSYDKYKKQYATDLRFVEECDLEKVLAESDILSLHVPLTPETSGMIDAGFLDKCKHGLVFINCSRGKVVDLASLITALYSGKIAGACLDVLPNEKPHMYTVEEQGMYDRLYACENVVLTPHVAGWTFRSKRNIAELLLTQILTLKAEALGEN